MAHGLGSCLDRLPRRALLVGTHLLPPWRLCVATGIVTSVVLAVPLGALARVPLTSLLGAAVASITVYIAALAIHRAIKGSDTHVLFEGLAIATIVGFAWHHLLSPVPLRGLDIHLAGFSVLMIFGRIGCFLGGCCYGVRFPFGVRYPPGFPGAGPRRFPVQLLESCAWVVIAALAAILTLAAPPGRAAGLVLAVYAVVRFALESLRDDRRRRWLGTSQSRVMALPTFLVGMVLLDWPIDGWPLAGGVIALLMAGALVATRRWWLGPPVTVPVDDLARLGREVLTHQAGQRTWAFHGIVVVAVADKHVLLVAVTGEQVEPDPEFAAACLNTIQKNLDLPPIGPRKHAIRLERPLAGPLAHGPLAQRLGG